MALIRLGPVKRQPNNKFTCRKLELFKGRYSTYVQKVDCNFPRTDIYGPGVTDRTFADYQSSRRKISCIRRMSPMAHRTAALATPVQCPGHVLSEVFSLLMWYLSVADCTRITRSLPSFLMNVTETKRPFAAAITRPLASMSALSFSAVYCSQDAL